MFYIQFCLVKSIHATLIFMLFPRFLRFGVCFMCESHALSILALAISALTYED